MAMALCICDTHVIKVNFLFLVDTRNRTCVNICNSLAHAHPSKVILHCYYQETGCTLFSKFPGQQGMRLCFF